MITVGIIVAVFTFIGTIIALYKAEKEDAYLLALVAWVLGAFFLLGVCMACVKWDKAQEPSAMDVYQGKTTIQYTIVDGVATDSTVVWKDITQQ